MSNYQLMPAGRYWGKLLRQELTTTKKSGNAQLVFRFALLGKINVEDPGGDLIPCLQCDRTIYRVITDKTIGYVMEDLDHLAEKAGITLDLPSFKMLDDRTPGFVSMIGAECELLCSHEPYENEMQERWSIYRLFESAPLEDDKVKGLDRLFGKHLRKPAKAPEAAAPADDEGFTPSEPPPAAKRTAAGQRRQTANAAATHAQAPLDLPGEDIPF